jgi:hypothetical protein
VAATAIQLFDDQDPHDKELARLIVELEQARVRNAELEDELLEARAKAGDLEPPTAIEDVYDARAWLAWARAHQHQDGCSCHRCPAARKLLP